MNRPHLIFLILFAPISIAAAQERFNADDRADAISPFVNDETVAIGRIDFKRLDLAATAKFLQLSFTPNDEAVSVEGEVKKLQAKIDMLNALATEFYFVGTLDEFPRSFGFIIAHVRAAEPGLGPSNHQQLASILVSGKRDGPTEIEKGQYPRQILGVPIEVAKPIDNYVFAGTRSTLDRLSRQKPVRRAEVAKAFAEAGDSTAQFLFIPTDNNRRVLGEMLPRLPDELGGGSGRAIAEGLRWASVGIEFPPKLKFDLTIQLSDRDSAGLVKGVISSAYLEVARMKPVRQALPKVDEILAELTPKVSNDKLTISIDHDDERLKSILMALKPPIEKSAIDARRTVSVNNLRHLAVGMHNYLTEHDQFPSVENVHLPNDKVAKHPHSWRVALLPYLEQKDLYDQYRFDEPWDSENNKKLINKMPAVFASPLAMSNAEGKTVYQVPIAKDSIFTKDKGTKIIEIKDGTSNTLLIVETHPSQAVTWTQPTDIQIDEKDPLKGLRGQKPGGLNACIADGSVRFLPDSIEAKDLRALLTKNGGETVR